MSYILDALKKSEQERGQGEVPNVQTVHSSSLNYGNEKKTYWPYILMAIVALNLLAITYFIFDKESRINNTATVIEKQETPEINEYSYSIEKSTQTNITASKSSDKSSNNNKKLKNNILNNTGTSRPSVIKVNENEITDYYDLPVRTKNSLPSIVISAHVFSTNPLQRSVVINNNFLEEGEYVLDGLVLHEITSDGAIFNYKGKLINYSVVSQWQ